MKELQALVRRLNGPDATPAVLATLVSVTGSSYRRPGARLLVLPSGERIGSISGGCLEEDVLVRASRVAATGQAETVIYDTTAENDLVWGVGLGCHGVVKVLIERLPNPPTWAAQLAANFSHRGSTRLAVCHQSDDPARCGTRLADDWNAHAHESVFVETITPPTRLVVFGAGDDAMPLVRLGAELGWHVTVADPRPAFARAERFPAANAVVVAPALELVNRVAPDAGTLAVVMTHHYVHDVPLLRGLLPQPLAYLGLLGPRKRAEQILSDLVKEGLAVTPALRQRLHAPVGLDLGAEGPEQVALAIVAEMQAVLSGRDAQPLRLRTRPIHG
jgi:xanthine/CO dehydrogenase XdhC/CoxF family maturation factor